MANQLIKVIIERHNQYLLASRNPRLSDRVRANKIETYIELEYILNAYCTAASVTPLWHYRNDGTIELHN